MPSQKAVAAAKKFLPKWEIVEEPEIATDVAAAAPDAVSVDPKVLKRKFFGEPPYASDAKAATPAQDAEIVTLRPAHGSDEKTRGGRRSLVVANGKVIGAQG